MLAIRDPVDYTPDPINLPISELVRHMLSEMDGPTVWLDVLDGLDWSAGELEPHGDTLGILISYQSVQAEVDIRDGFDRVLHEVPVLV